MLGTNDLKANFNLSAFDIARRASRLLVAAKSFRPEIAHVLLMSKALAAHYRHFAELNECHFFDAASIAQTSSVDGIHIDAQNHKLLGQGLARKIASIFEGVLPLPTYQSNNYPCIRESSASWEVEAGRRY